MSVRIDENTDHMKYTDDMEAIDSDIMDRVIAEMNSYDADIYTAEDVKEALAAVTLYTTFQNNTWKLLISLYGVCPLDFKALLSPAALPFLEEIAQKAQKETRKHFGNSVAIFTPLYIANYCENYCIYCGFNCHNKIHRARLTPEEIDKEMAAIAATSEICARKLQIPSGMKRFVTVQSTRRLSFFRSTAFMWQRYRTAMAAVRI